MHVHPATSPACRTAVAPLAKRKTSALQQLNRTGGASLYVVYISEDDWRFEPALPGSPTKDLAYAAGEGGQARYSPGQDVRGEAGAEAGGMRATPSTVDVSIIESSEF